MLSQANGHWWMQKEVDGGVLSVWMGEVGSGNAISILLDTDCDQSRTLPIICSIFTFFCPPTTGNATEPLSNQKRKGAKPH